VSIKLIEHIEITDPSITSVTLTDGGDWSDYTDLKLVYSARISGGSGTYTTCFLHINGSEQSTGKQLYGTGSSAASHSAFYLYTVNGAATANTYSNGEIYFSAPTSTTQHKWYSIDLVNENNAAATIHLIGAGTYASNTAISSIGFVPLSGDVEEGSTFTLFGTTSGSDGTTTVS